MNTKISSRLTLIGIVMAYLAFPLFGCSQNNEQLILQAKTDIQHIAEAIEQLYEDKGVLPVDLQDGETPEGQERIQNLFEGVGLGDNGQRTFRDVLMPLVHFGYLNEIPQDPFVANPNPEQPEWNTYIYYDEDEQIPNFDGSIAFTHSRLQTRSPNNWHLFSPGPDQTIGRPYSGDNIYFSRYQYYMQYKSEELIEMSYANMNAIGQAIEQLWNDKGVLLVDHWDDDRYEGRMRLQTIFEGVGDLTESQRNGDAVLEPLVHFGYLAEIPIDPVAFPFGRTTESFGTPLTGYLYADNDPELDGLDYGLSWLERQLEPGEWVLVGTAPYENELEPGTRITFPYDKRIYISNQNIPTQVTDWEIY